MLRFTGERYLPDVDGQIELEHLHRYLLASHLVSGKVVLDIASGEGYGTSLLAKSAETVVGVDISHEAVEHARSRYAANSNARFLVGACEDIPLNDASVDVVVSFETIEHHDKHEAMMREVKRVLRANGLLIISSPDRYNYSIATGYKNEYHVKELYRHEFEQLLARHFKNRSVLGQRVAYGSFILPETRNGFVSYRKSGSSIEGSRGIVDPVYLIALASDAKLPACEGGLFDSPLESSDLVRELQRRLAERDGQVKGLTHAVEARDVEVAELRGQVDGLRNAITVREAELAQERGALAARNAAYGDLESLAEQLKVRVHQLDSAVAGLESACADRIRERADAQQQAEIAKSELAQRIPSLEAQLASVRERSAGLEAAHAALVRETEVQSRAFDDLSKRHADLKDTSAVRDATLRETEGRLQALAAEAESARHELSKARELSAQQGDELRARDVALLESHARLAATVQALEVTRHELSSERARAEQAATELCRTEQRLSSEVERLLTQLRSLSLELAGRDTELGAAYAKLAEVESDQQALREALAADQLRLVSSQQRALELEGMVGDHQRVIEQIWKSRSWRLTKGLRFAGRLTRGDWRGAAGSVSRFLGLVNAKPSAVGLSPLTASASSSAPTLVSDPAPEPKQPAVAAIPPVSAQASLSDPAPVESPQPMVQPTTSGFRILLVSYYCPSRSHAGGLRILDLYALIRRKLPDAELHLYTHRRPLIDWWEDEVSSIFDRVYWSPTEELSAAGLTALARGPQRFDVVDLQFHQAAFDIDAYRLMGRTILFTPMESLARFAFLQARSAFRETRRFPLRELARSFRAVAEEVVFSFRVDKVVCVSRADAAFLRAVTCLRSVHSLETGVSEIEFPGAGAGGQLRDLAAAGRTVLYVAYFGSQTNVDALRWYLEQVHPSIVDRVAGYKFVVVGRGDLTAFAGYAGPTVDFVGEVPRIAPYIESARVGIAPALGGSGFRGKVNQYALFGVPTVASPISAKGLAYQPGKDILIGRSAQEFADHCIALLLDDELNLTIGNAARATCGDKYTWESKWPTVARLYGIPGFNS